MGMENHRKRFDKAAKKYNTDRYPGRGHCARLVLDFLEPCSDDIVLDVGCGPGEHLISLSPGIGAGYGIDLSEEMIRRAREVSRDYSNLSFFVGTANQIPGELQRICFTKILTNYTLHHLPSVKKAEAILLLSDLLAPGGRFILGDLMISDDPDKYESLFEYVGYGPGPDTPSRVDELEPMFIEAGLKCMTRILNPLVGLIVGSKAL